MCALQLKYLQKPWEIFSDLKNSQGIQISLLQHAQSYVKCYKRSLEERTSANSFCIEKNRINLKWDGRCDSPDHNEKYLTYSIFYQSLKKVIAVFLIQEIEV